MEVIDSYRVPTVRVKRDGGRGVKIINLSEYDPDLHELADATPAGEPQDEPAPPTQQAIEPQPRRRGRPPKLRT